MNERPPFPPFTAETAAQKARAAEDAWNTCDPERVSLAYTHDSRWRNRDTFLHGRSTSWRSCIRSGPANWSTG